MKISATMSKYYLGYLAVGWFGGNAEPAENVAAYAPIVRDIRVLAENAGDLSWLRSGLEHLLAAPGVRLMEYGGGLYPFSAAEIRDHLHFLWKSHCPRVELFEMDADAWLAHRQRMSGP